MQQMFPADIAHLRKESVMLTKQVLEIFDLLDREDASGALLKTYLESLGAEDVTVEKLGTGEQTTDSIRVCIPGTRGKRSGGQAPTLGILGRLGGLGARPEQIGFVSDGDGALAALSVAAKLLDMRRKGDMLEGDVVVCTHIDPKAPTQPHDPVPFMGSSVDIDTVNRAEVSDDIDAILCVDTTKGNRILNHNGIAISPTVKDGYILRVSDALMDVMQIVTGKAPYVFAITQQDITPYGNDLYHLNSIMQPCTVTSAPVVGVAITAETMVPGCATGASRCEDVEAAALFMLEAAKVFGRGKCPFYDEAEFEKIVALYGDMRHFQKLGRH